MLFSVSFTACAISASSNTIARPLPLSSKINFFEFDFAEAICVARPFLVLPVKDKHRTFICSARALPAMCPWPDKILITPGGKPHFSIQVLSSYAVSGAFLLLFRTTVFPAATAGATFFTEEHQRRILRYDDGNDAVRLSERHLEEAKRVQTGVVLTVRCFGKIVEVSRGVVAVEESVDRTTHGNRNEAGQFILSVRTSSAMRLRSIPRFWRESAVQVGRTAETVATAVPTSSREASGTGAEFGGCLRCCGGARHMQYTFIVSSRIIRYGILYLFAKLEVIDHSKDFFRDTLTAI